MLKYEHSLEMNPFLLFLPLFPLPLCMYHSTGYLNNLLLKVVNSFSTNFGVKITLGGRL